MAGHGAELSLPRRSWFRPRGLFGKYVIAFVGLIVLVLGTNAALEAWFTYNYTIGVLVKTQSDKAEAAARRIQQFVDEIERQISFATRASASTIEQHIADYQLLLREVPAIEQLRQLNGKGMEQLMVNRSEVVKNSGADYSRSPSFTEARGRSVWASPADFEGSAPVMSIVMPHSGLNAGYTVAQINLESLSTLLDSSQIGNDYEAYLIGPLGRLLAHSNRERRLGTSLGELPQVRAAMKQEGEPPTFGLDPDGRSVLIASAVVPRLNWHVFVEQPRSTALQPVYRVLNRTALLAAIGVLLAIIAGIWLARQMVVPIRALQVGAQQLEASEFGHRIEVRSGDEISDLADHFNRMAEQLRESYARLEQKVEERTRALAQSVSELKALEEIGRAVASSLDTKAVLATIVTRAVQLTRADAGAIYRYDASRKLFELAEAHALEQGFQDAIRSAHIKFDENIFGLAYDERHAIALPDLRQSPDFPLRDATLAAGFHSILVVPLLTQYEILGALVVQRRSVGDFPAGTIDLMQTFAHQSVLALNNARMFLEVEQKGRELAIANEHKTQFFANMSHELRTPLNGILGFSELLTDGLYGKLPDKAMEVLDRIQKDGKHLLGLINDVLDISKIEAGQLSLSLSDYSVQSIVDTVVASTEALAHTKGIEVRTAVPPDLPIGHGDERRLTQVLLNIVGNAIKFTDTGSVEVRVDATEGYFKIAVEDTGPGIPLADQQRVFDDFQQVDSGITRHKGGTGLGLSISRRLVQAHGGHIELHSWQGVGSTFNIVVPVRVSEQRQVA